MGYEKNNKVAVWGLGCERGGTWGSVRRLQKKTEARL